MSRADSDPAIAARGGPRARRVAAFGWAGLACGVLALALGLLPPWIAPLYDAGPKPVTQRATDWLGELKDKTVSALRSDGLPASPASEQHNIWRDPRIAVASLLFAFTALVLSIIAFVRHEDQRLVACSVALSAGTISTQYFPTALLILVFAMLVGVVLTRNA